MKILAYFVIVLVLVTLQVSFFGHFRVLGIMPNLLLILIIINGLHSTASSTVALALSGGLLLDMVSGENFGIRMAFYTLAALGVIVIRQLGFRLDGLWMVGLLAALGTITFNAIIMASLGVSAVFGNVFSMMNMVGAEVMVNLFIIVLIQFLLITLGVSSSHGEPGMRKRTLFRANK